MNQANFQAVRQLQEILDDGGLSQGIYDLIHQAKQEVSNKAAEFMLAEKYPEHQFDSMNQYDVQVDGDKVTVYCPNGFIAYADCEDWT